MSIKKILFLFAAFALLAPAFGEQRVMQARVSANATKCEGKDCPCSLPPRKCLTTTETTGCKPDTDDDDDKASSLMETGSKSGCPGDDAGSAGGDSGEDGGISSGNEDLQKPSSDLAETLDNLEAWNNYLDKMVNPNPMAAASERADQLAAALKRKHDAQEMQLQDSNENLRMKIKGGLMQVLSKAATKWEAEQRADAQAQDAQAKLQSIRDAIKRLEGQRAQLQKLNAAAGGPPKSTAEQIKEIVANAQANQESPDNKAAFEWLAKQAASYKPPAKKGSF